MNAVRRFLPSTRLLLIVGIPGVALIIAGIIFALPHNPSPTGVLVTDASISEQRGVITTVDSDNDGLPDWQEALIGTNPKNPDTDGDGVPDGTEVLTGHDPLKKGPDDLVQKDTTPTTHTPSVAPQTYTPLTKTQSFSQNLLSKLVTMQSSGMSLDDPANVQTLANSIAGGFAPDATSNLYGESDITIIQNDDSADLLAYSNGTASLFSKLGSQTTAAGQGTATDFQKTAQVSALFTTAIKNILAMPVPPTFVQEHLALLNAVANLAQNMEILATTEKDPVAGIAALQRQGDLMTSFQTAIESLRSAIVGADIPFASSDIGYTYWLKKNAPTQ